VEALNVAYRFDSETTWEERRRTAKDPREKRVLDAVINGNITAGTPKAARIEALEQQANRIENAMERAKELVALVEFNLDRIEEKKQRKKVGFAKNQTCAGNCSFCKANRTISLAELKQFAKYLGPREIKILSRDLSPEDRRRFLAGE
jgi:hypothetical protein